MYRQAKWRILEGYGEGKLAVSNAVEYGRRVPISHFLYQLQTAGTSIAIPTSANIFDLGGDASHQVYISVADTMLQSYKLTLL